MPDKEIDVAKKILDKWATVVLRVSAVHEKNSVSIPNLKKAEDYTPEKYKDDIVLWIPPKNCIRLEFDDDHDTNIRCIRECEMALKSIEFDYCITEHEGGKSPYINIFNIKGMPLGEDNPLAKNLLIDMFAGNVIQEGMDRSNLGYTYSPVIGHPHWKKKYKKAVHKIVRGKNPLDHKNNYPKKLLKQIEKSRINYKYDMIQVKENYPWVNDFLINYCTTHKFPVGNRNITVEKNLAILIIHHKDRDKIMQQYLKVQERKHNSLKGWFTKVIKGDIGQVNPFELKKYIKANNIPYELPDTKVKKTVLQKQQNVAPQQQKYNPTLEALKDPNLLLNTVDEIQKEDVEGEEDTIIVIVIKTMLRFLENPYKPSQNLILSARPGFGKDAVVQDTLKVIVYHEDYKHKTHLSDKSLLYFGLKYPEWNWDGKVLYLEDPKKDTTQSASFRTMATGKSESGTVIDKEYVDLKVKGKPVMIITSYQETLELEGERRWGIKKTDETTELSMVCSNTYAKTITGKLNDKKVEKNEALRLGLQTLLKPYEVVIPFFELLCKDKFSNNRYYIKNLADYISACTILHQHQRKKDKQGRLIATIFDWDVGLFVFNELHNTPDISLSIKENELVLFLSKHDIARSFAEIEEGTTLSSTWLYDNATRLQERRIVKVAYIEKECGFTTKPVKCFFLPEHKMIIELPFSYELASFSDDFPMIFQYGYKKDITENMYVYLCKSINEKRKKDNLQEIKNFNFLKNKKDPYIRSSKNGENRGNPSVGSENENWNITKLEDFMEKAEDNRSGGVDYDTLIKNFPLNFIDNCRKKAVIIKNEIGNFQYSGGRIKLKSFENIRPVDESLPSKTKKVDEKNEKTNEKSVKKDVKVDERGDSVF